MNNSNHKTQPGLSKPEHRALSDDLREIQKRLSFLCEVYRDRVDVALPAVTEPQNEWLRGYVQLAKAFGQVAHDAIQEATAAYGPDFTARCYVRNGSLLGGFGGGNTLELEALGGDSVSVLKRKLLCAKCGELKEKETGDSLWCFECSAS